MTNPCPIRGCTRSQPEPICGEHLLRYRLIDSGWPANDAHHVADVAWRIITERGAVR